MLEVEQRKLSLTAELSQRLQDLEPRLEDIAADSAAQDGRAAGRHVATGRAG
jgi:hypothetical protein